MSGRHTGTGRSPIETVLPLAPLQNGLLFHILASGDGPAVYNVQWSATVHGAFDVPAYQEAWQRLVHRHAGLRVAFDWTRAREPLQLLYREAAVACRAVDLSAIDEAAREERWSTLLDTDRAQRFAIETPPLLRLTAVRIGDREHRVIVTFSHLLLDGWSFALIRRELLAEYRAVLAGTAPHAAPTAADLDAYFVWLASRGEEASRRFWQDAFEDFDGSQRIGWIAPAPPETPLIGEIVSPLDDLAERLIETARRARVTRHTVLLGAWLLTLARLLDSTDVACGVVVSGRPSSLPDANDLVGCFINTTPFRFRFDDREPVGEALRRIMQSMARAEEHAHIPLGSIQSWTIGGRQPLIDTLFVYENYPYAEADATLLADFTIQQGAVHDASTFPLGITIDPGPPLRARFEYDRRRIDSNLLAIVPSIYTSILRTLCAEPAATLGEVLDRSASLDLPREREREPEAAQASPLAIGASVPLAANVSPDDAATIRVGADGVLQVVTFAQLRRAAEDLSMRLRAAGTGPEDVIGILGTRSTDLIVSLYAVWQTGAACLLLDPADPPARRAELLADCSAVDIAVVTTPQSSETRPRAAPPTSPHPDNAAYVMYTSGSTAAPKGVVVTYAALMNHAAACCARYGLTASDRVLQLASPAFDVCLEEIVPTLAAGGAVVLPERPGPCTLDELSRIADAASVTVMNLPAGYWRAWMQALAAGAIQMPRSIRLIVIGSEAIDPEALHQWHALPAASAVTLINGYGTTETTITATTARLDREDDEATPIGTAIRQTTAYLLDRRLHPTPRGVWGELWIGGAAVARGYVRQPARTAERFLPDPFSPPGGRMYRTGDRARRRADGQITIAGRRDRQVKVRGVRVELDEIEHRVAAHPAVAAAAVVLHEVTGGIGAYVVLRDPQARPAALLEDLAAVLPAAMMPRSIQVLESLPRTTSGKIDRRSLPPPRIDERAPEHDLNAVEEMLAALFHRVLGTFPRSPADDFFALGGHSLAAIHLLACIRDAFGVELPLATVLERSTLAAMASAIRAAAAGTALAGAAAAGLVRTNAAAAPLGEAGRRLWSIIERTGATAFFNVPIALRVRGPLDAEALQHAIAAVADRHDVLRSTVSAIDGEPCLTPSDLVYPVPLISLEREADPIQAARQVAREEAALPFDLTAGPAWRAGILRLSTDDHVVLLSTHHLIVDGHSLDILDREIAEIYRARVSGRPCLLPTIDFRFADYAIWERRRIREGSFQHDIDYWQSELAAPLTPLSLDSPPQAATPFEYALFEQVLDDDLHARVHKAGAALGATRFSLVLAALHRGLATLTEQGDVRTAILSANRTRSETRGLVGLLMNTLVVRTRTSPDEAFSTVIRAVRRKLALAHGHSEAPFELVADAVGRHDPSLASPLFEVLVAAQHSRPPSAGFSGLAIEPFTDDDAAPQTIVGRAPLIVEIHDGERLRILWKYRQGRLSADRVGALADRLARALAEAGG